ncbi:MAG: enoyl-CoA hydratase/isomerase family protein [Deltaproteobacteria bacterium]|nr:enoyl-CoA hydratase/isomerase family protein [Deltaproteobacteria bacterium]
MKLWRAETGTNGVVVATYTNPPMNYFCAEATQELGTLIRQWADPSVRAVVLTGGMRGKFITHYSVEELAQLASDRPMLAALGRSLNHGYHELLGSLRDLAKPVIAALNGDTMGGGFELSLACDIRIAAAGDHRIGLPEITLGILPGGSGTQRLSRLLGASRAIDFILRGRICRPEEALAFGLVHEVADDALARANALAAGLAELSPVAVAEIKRSVYQGSELHLEAGLVIEAEAFMTTMRSDEGLAAMNEYVALPLEKRRGWLERRAPLLHPKR